MPSAGAPRRAFDLLPDRPTRVQRQAIRRRDQGLREPRCGKSPTMFWAKCLQAICYIQTARVRRGKVVVERLHRRPTPISPGSICCAASPAASSAPLSEPRPAPVRARGRAESVGRQLEFDEAEADFQQALDRLNSTPDTTFSIFS